MDDMQSAGLEYGIVLKDLGLSLLQIVFPLANYSSSGHRSSVQG